MRYSTPQRLYAKLTPIAGGYAFNSSYDASLIAAFKSSIPSTARRWDGNNKYWIVDAQYANECIKLARIYLGVDIVLPTQGALNMPPQVETKLIKVEYLGRCKDRGNGELSATGFSDGGWNVIFPEDVLRGWFEAEPARPDEKQTYYAVLCVKQSATPEELKSSWRRLARQWHPDVCKEEHADRQFMLIQHAYEILSNPLTRKKYDAGLLMQNSTSKQTITRNNAQDYIYDMNGVLHGFRSPLRCGWLLVEAKTILGRLTVEKILAWEDVTNASGKVMVSSWPAGATNFEVTWS